MMLNLLQRRPEGRASRAIGVSRAALYGTTALVLGAVVISPAVADEVDELKTEMQQLLDRMEQLERGQADTDAAVRQANVEIDEVASNDTSIAQALRELATNYQYDELNDLFRE